MVKNDICFEGSSKQNVLFSKNVPQKTHPCPQFSRQVGHHAWPTEKEIFQLKLSKMARNNYYFSPNFLTPSQFVI